MNRKKDKQVLIKRIIFFENEYDFLYLQEKDAIKNIEASKDCVSGLKFVKPNLYERFSYSLKKFFNEKNKEIIFSIFIIALTLLGQYIYDKWIKP